MLQYSTLIWVDHGLDNRATIDMNELNNAQKNELRNIIDAGYNPYAQYWWSFNKVEILKLEVLEATDTTASVDVVLALTKPDSTVINQSVVYRLTRPTGDDPWTIADSSP